MQTSVTNAVCPGGGQLLQCSALYMPLLSVFVKSYWGRKWVEHRQKETKQVIELNKEWGRERGEAEEEEIGARGAREVDLDRKSLLPSHLSIM